MISFQTFTDLPAEPLMTALLDLHTRVFEGQSCDEVAADMRYHQRGGRFLLDIALWQERIVGYKAGYERKPGHFYSWLGCVDPDFRGRGIADALMRQQHEWCTEKGYAFVRTQTYNQWRGMLILNLNHGFDVIGTLQGAHGLLIVLEKRLLTAI